MVPQDEKTKLEEENAQLKRELRTARLDRDLTAVENRELLSEALEIDDKLLALQTLWGELFREGHVLEVSPIVSRMSTLIARLR